ncbi:MAG TPA: cell envelope integrity protein CreD [Arenimonas sp.]|uniref:cell envelope integrity protein CreD n=1 Tax=Arenimonas sp. TaxID=1872635 RepID=UPI002CE8FF56|nr:cell envelope integrity protein CreD [Arenimonas sp.]HMB57106.1 cell envelope integrity protein CreD [Arenimonas sp.]
MSRMHFVFKGALVAFLSLLLLVPLMVINGTIGERQAYRSEAVETVTQSFAGPQTLVGPVLVVPYAEQVQVVSKDKNDNDVTRTETQQKQWFFFPKAMTLDGGIRPSERKLGLYNVRIYELQTRIAANFDAVVPNDAGVVRTIGQPYLSLSISDVRGLAGTPVLKVDHVPVALMQNVGGHRKDNGLHAPLPAVAFGQHVAMTVDLQLALGGTETLAVAPIADSNHITLKSAWPHPHFAGSFLPHDHTIGDQGFNANWDISSLAAGTQGQYLEGDDKQMDVLSIGLVEPVNVYTQVDRASKYGFLFVMLTFVGFFMFELIKRLAIHPIQYGLVGLALAIFFLLLLSLSERIEFWIAYLIASVACIGLLGVYLSAVLKSRGRGLAFAAMLTLLYAALYGLLVSEDNAMVLGSLMLFAILAAIMLVTRKIDWYALSAGNAPPPIPAPAFSESTAASA